MKLFSDDDLAKTKKAADDVIGAVGRTIEAGNVPVEYYADVVGAFTQLITARAELDY